MRLTVIARLVPLLVTLPLLGETMVGLTSTGALVRFDSATPGTFISGPTAITNVTAGYTVVAIDRRPATGQLYALAFDFAAVGVEMQVYTVNETTGAATALGSAFSAPRAIGSTLNAATRFGFDFSPVSDVLRVVSTGRDNFRIAPSTGAVLSADTIITPAGTQLAGTAYSNNVSGASSTTLYAIDTATNPDQLVVIGGNPVPPGASPNGGVASIVGSLGVDTSGELGFEITPSGAALAAMTVGGTSGLYSIDVGSGVASFVGTFQGGATLTGLTRGGPISPVPNELMVGLTSTGALVGFNSATPGTFTSGPTPITGLTPGYTVVGIDRRPATGQLYALAFNFAAVGTEMQVYIVNESIGAATPLGSAFSAPRAIGSTLNAATRFGVDFDPANDLLRVVSSGRDNFRVSPTTGAVVGSADTIITPGGTQLPGAAYANNVANATSTTLYAIDTSATPDQLVVIGGNPVPPGASPNAGVATVVGPLGPDTSAGDLGFEITPSGNALTAMSVSGTSGLYTVDLATGAASLIGTFQGGAIVSGLTSGITPPAPPSEPMVGLTSTGALVGFNSATPGTFTSGPTAITGVTAGYTVVGIDRRPATGQLYALAFNFAAVGSEMQVYTLNETTGAATALGSAFSAPRAIGSTLSAATRFGFDFSPVSDVLRVVSTGRDNFRINPTTGAVLSADTILTPAGTQVPGAAYSNNVSSATSTTLYAIDTGATPDQLIFIGGNPVPPGASPNGGVATVVGLLGPETSAGDLGFEITPTGNALAAMPVSGTSGLYSIDLGTGAATFIGTFQGGAIVTGLTNALPANATVSGTKTVSGTFTAGGTVTYTIVLTNNGGLTQADNLGNEFTDVLPSSLTLVSANATSGTAVASVGTNTVTWNGPLAASGGSVTITITATVGAIAGGTVISNQGSISYDGDSNGSNEASAVTDDPGVGGAADPTSFTVMGPIVSGTKTASGTYVVGGAVTYTIVLSNSGNAAAPDNGGNEFTDVLPVGLTLVSANATSGTAAATIPTRTVTWNGSIPASGSVTITINATINSGTAGTMLTNQGAFAYDADLNGTNETNGVTDDPGTGTAGDGTAIFVAGVAVDAVSKSVSGTFFAGSIVTYTIVISNSGNAASGDNLGNELTDVLPPQLTLISANATSGTAVATIGTNTVTWNGSVPASGSVTITIAATINNVPPGTPVSNQATHSYDSDTDGTNDATALSNDPSTAAPSDPTIFVVAASAAGIPTLSELGLLLFALALGLAAAKAVKG